MTDKEYVSSLVARARKAQAVAESFTQEYVDMLSRKIGWALVQQETVEKIAAFCLKETQMGTLEAKQNKLYKKVRGVLRDINPQKSVGVVEELPELGICRIGKPVGVIGSLIPTTQPELCPATQAMLAVKARDAIVFAPHPRSQKTTLMVTDIIRKVLQKNGAPEDLVICIENPTIVMSTELMEQTNLVIATGGSGMVKAAYSSGTPAYGVGVGNAVVVVDETADLKQAAHNIHVSKVFDYASGCSCDNSIVVQENIYDAFMECLKAEGAFLIAPECKPQLQKTIWPEWPENHVLNRDIVTQPAKRIADLAGIDKVSADCEFILVEEDGYGEQYPFSGEKLSLVLTIYKYKEFTDAIDMVNTIQRYSGYGHSCGIHSNNREHIEQLALKTYTTKVIVRQPHGVANSGSWQNGLARTFSLGCGTWGGNIVSENITQKHYYNITWVAEPIDRQPAPEEEIFGDLLEGVVL